MAELGGAPGGAPGAVETHPGTPTETPTNTTFPHMKGKENEKPTSTLMLADEVAVNNCNRPSGADTLATGRSLEAEDLSPPESSPINHHHGAPEP